MNKCFVRLIFNYIGETILLHQCNSILSFLSFNLLCTTSVNAKIKCQSNHSKIESKPIVCFHMAIILLWLWFRRRKTQNIFNKAVKVHKTKIISKENLNWGLGALTYLYLYKPTTSSSGSSVARFKLSRQSFFALNNFVCL